MPEISRFADRRLVIATKHAKERVIAPLLEAALGVECVTCDTLDTDLLGTFTGEVDRTLNPLETAREKCRRAMQSTGCDLAVASEGSFGPHPVMVFAPGDEELLVFVDQRDGLEIVAREISADTNFAAAEVDSEQALLAFANKAQFPGHALILRKSRDSADDIHKGICDRAQLLAIYAELRERYGTVWVETDMRAMHNPSRLRVISEVTRKLIERLESQCPACAAPGFTVTDVVRGLPCELCGLPTRGAQRLVLVCKHCDWRQEKPNPDGKTAENPMYCDFCNP
jgi:hypothetical protein